MARRRGGRGRTGRPARRYEATIERLNGLIRLVRCLFLDEPAEAAIEAAFPWISALPEDGRTEFLDEIASIVRDSVDSDVWVTLEQALIEWKATAAIYNDPELREALRRPLTIDEDLGPVLPPELPGLAPS